MFKRNPAPTFTVPVPLSVPGSPEPVDLQVTFRHKNKDALKAWMHSGKEDAIMLHEVIVEWADMQGPDGEPVAYSLAELQGLLSDFPAAHGELFRVYMRELTASKAKNS